MFLLVFDAPDGVAGTDLPRSVDGKLSWKTSKRLFTKPCLMCYVLLDTRPTMHLPIDVGAWLFLRGGRGRGGIPPWRRTQNARWMWDSAPSAPSRIRSGGTLGKPCLPRGTHLTSPGPCPGQHASFAWIPPPPTIHDGIFPFVRWSSLSSPSFSPD